MTRFARAVGTKAANSREPEEATAWKDMKANMAREMPNKAKNTPTEEGTSKGTPKGKDKNKDKRKLKMRNPEDEDDDLVEPTYQDEPMDTNDTADLEDSGESDADENDDDESKDGKTSTGALLDADDLKREKKKKARKLKCLNCKEPGHWKKDCPQLSEDRRKELTELEQMKRDRKGKGTGRKKNKKKDKDEENENGQSEEKSNGNSKEQKGNKKGSQNNKKDGKNKRRKEIKDKTGAIVQDGEGLFQGFRVQEKDVQRLHELQKKMTKEGMKPDELAAALKLARRRAEKDLARSKKNVCFNCRQPGHMVADCPETDIKKPGGSATENSMCFKCGAADHTSKSCTNSKRKGEDAYAFATCFICKEKGHLAKACPDNPKGLYPKGGGCRFCGSVEHLKSECPRKKQKDEREELRVGRTDASSGVEEMDAVFTEGQRKRKMEGDSKAVNGSGKKTKKVVTF